MALEAGDEARRLAGVGEVGRADADVLGRPVAAAQLLDRPAQRLEQRRRLVAGADRR